MVRVELLLALVAYLSAAIMSAADANSALDAHLKPISEARRLYCEECRTSCGAANGRDRDRDRDEAAADSAGLKASSSSSSSSSSSDALVSLECRCKSVFDLKRRTFTCKNMSRAEAKLAATANNCQKRNKLAAGIQDATNNCTSLDGEPTQAGPQLAPTRQTRLEAKAVAGSQLSDKIK